MKWHTKQQKLKKLYDDNYNIYHEKNLYPVNLERTITQFLFLPITLSGEKDLSLRSSDSWIYFMLIVTVACLRKR